MLVPGRINAGKGEQLLAALLRQPLPGIEFILLGAGRSGMRFFGCSGVHVLMDYRRDELPAHIARLQPDLAAPHEVFHACLPSSGSLAVDRRARAVRRRPRSRGDGSARRRPPPWGRQRERAPSPAGFSDATPTGRVVRARGSRVRRAAHDLLAPSPPFQ